MTRYIIRRLIQSIPTIFGITLLSYLIILAAPGNPADLMTFGSDQVTNLTQIIEDRWGLNDPWIMQYITWLTGNDWQIWKNRYDENGEEIFRYKSYGVLRLDFGDSISKRQPVIELIQQRIGATLELGIASLMVALVIGLPIGILAAASRGSLFDNITRIGAVLGHAIPIFWLGLMLLLFFGILMDIKWARGDRCDTVANSRTGCGVVPIYERAQYLLLPTIALATGGVANFSRFMRTSMLDTINSDYIRTARAKGLRNRTVWVKHAARNSLIPIATFLGPAIVGTFSGAAITERIYSWPGMGRLFVDSAVARDYPVVMAILLITAVLTVFGYIISDILYALFDPRIRF